jgi:hypothetical protein
MTKLGFTAKEVGRLTLSLFNKLYQQYKNTFDLEMRLTKANMTYEELYKKSQKDEEWL